MGRLCVQGIGVAPRNAASAGSHYTQVRVGGGRRTETVRVGGCENVPSANNFCVCMHARRPPATTSLRGGATRVRQRPTTRDSCRTLPPRSQPQFTPTHREESFCRVPRTSIAAARVADGDSVRAFRCGIAAARGANYSKFLEDGSPGALRTKRRRDPFPARSHPSS